MSLPPNRTFRLSAIGSPLIALIAAMTALRVIYASLIDLRTDEAYYWTWSKENVLSFLDHPPMIAWFIRFGTAIFGDTNFGVRFAGIVAMLVTQLLLADIVRRVTHDIRAVVLAVLMPEAALYYGLLMAKVSPDVALIPFAVAMLWALVRLWRERRCALVAGRGRIRRTGAVVEIHRRDAVAGGAGVHAGAGLALALAAQPYPWLAALIAVVLFLPVLIWNAEHDWASFRFQFVRATATHEIVAAHRRRFYRPAVRAGRVRPAAGGVVGAGADGMAGISPRASRSPSCCRPP